MPTQLDVRRAARAICSWMYTDSLVQLDEKRVAAAILQDCAFDGYYQCQLPAPTEAECELLVCGDADDPAVVALNKRFPTLDALLNEEF